MRLHLFNLCARPAVHLHLILLNAFFDAAVSFHSSRAIATSALFFFPLYTPQLTRAAYFESCRRQIDLSRASGAVRA